MRRPMQALNQEAIESILEKIATGVLGLINTKGYPYTVPLNFVYLDGAVYFHGSFVGEKMTALKENSKASFTVISKDKVFQEGLTTLYESVICFGHMSLVENKEEKEKALEAFLYKYTPDFIEKGRASIKSSVDRTCVFKMTLSEMTGKKSK